MKNAREQIVDLLVLLEREKGYVQLVLKEELRGVDSKDKGFVTEIVYGTLKYRLKLDYVINQFSKTSVHKMKPFIRQLLRMSVYQLISLDKVPASAVINEAVKLTKKRGFINLSGFVNGVLRTIDRQKESLTYPNRQEKPLTYLSVIYSIPEWIIQEWLKDYSFEEVEAICEAMNERARVAIRINTLCTTKEEVQKILLKEGIQTEEGTFLEEALYLKKSEDIQRLPSYQAGKWTVQDESAMLVAHVVNPQPGERILDMCSAPGGKSLHLAALMKNQGEIISSDIYPHKVELIRQNAERMQATIVHPTLQDGTLLEEKFIESFDRVLLDAPCSGLGILKRKPDIRYNKTKEDLGAIANIQRQLAQKAACYLKAGGVLVYSTCTISKSENEEMAHWIEQSLGLEKLNIVDTIPKSLRAFIKEGNRLQILPTMADTDGFFIAAFKKRG
ncbi:16S rRNA (cytosine(967)-C(5))-methyltransferase [Sporanaerobium hydrogeniformans]|uniref:16S rRNA (Cytosine(967)-C(5))-methyltransferase n=1 Tax=Sporanaerobium hydrogeniformans TaxID=3072179 RepID=A0AC61DG51_9FIRM|nr:16S rRNA (cytosine(967)-C(5))-methyltransferase RsmB [Sporanaerobium hydrogeniformans]PHV71803.1 16S rRNA (cytosine(967)-C(5))-methyltransferase [Sporanaerobium hydrogeniformans]